MKSFMAAAPKRTLTSSFRGVKSRAEARIGFRGNSGCLLSSSAANPTAAFVQNDDKNAKTKAFSPLKREQTRNYTVMGKYPTTTCINSMMPSSSPFTQGLSVRTNSDEKKLDDEETLPPPIPGDIDDADDLTFEDPNEEKHDPEDLDGSRVNFTVPIVINMPDMNDDNLISKIEKWYKEPGDIIKRNDILCDITTPDFTFGMVTEDDVDAIMGEQHVQEGESAEDNAPICTIYHEPDEKDTTE
ncbi:MAG: hypothetical protein SGBAC_012776 [Bacillariaceae sp.]